MVATGTGVNYTIKLSLITAGPKVELEYHLIAAPGYHDIVIEFMLEYVK